MKAGAIERVALRNIGVDPLAPEQALGRVEGFIADGGRRYVCFCEANLLAHADRNSRTAAALNRAGMVLADGVALTALARLAGTPLPARVPGPSFLPAACEYGLTRGWRHFFYGGGEGVAEKLAASLSGRFPGLIVAGTSTPPFRALDAQEEEALGRTIRDARPHLLWVALGGPKQELWMADHVGRLDVPVMLGVGAAFDFHSGRRVWAPRWIRAAGMEWLFRTLTGGRRTLFRNAWCVPIVAGMLCREMIRHLVKGRRDPASA
jgi:N-acetylglucosaminyldiphosphoundecaprenol N-acetyl-beta-D-mannosaminyltransferase